MDWLARLVTHIHSRYEKTVRYYGWYSNKSRGMRKKADLYDTIPAVIPNEMSSKEFRQSWARLIQKIYEVDPLICSKCQGEMRIISFIEELDIIEKSYAILNFGISVSMIRRNRSFSILFLIWFTTFPIPKSHQSAGGIFQAIDNLFILCYTLLEKKEVPILKSCFLDLCRTLCFAIIAPNLPKKP